MDLKCAPAFSRLMTNLRKQVQVLSFVGSCISPWKLVAVTKPAICNWQRSGNPVWDDVLSSQPFCLSSYLLVPCQIEDWSYVIQKKWWKNTRDSKKEGMKTPAQKSCHSCSGEQNPLDRHAQTTSRIGSLGHRRIVRQNLVKTALTECKDDVKMCWCWWFN